MKILLSIHLYPPHHCAGAELYIHNLSKYLISKGHQVRCLLNEAKMHNIVEIFEYEGVEIFPPGINQMDIFRWADICLTHLGYAPWSLGVCGASEVNKPCVFISHNTWKYDSVVQRPWAKVIYNSEAMRDILKYDNESVVLHPPCDFREYDLGKDPKENEFITIVNVNKNKGGKIFFNIAKAMPERKFLAVRGAYDPQWEESLPNVTLIDNTPNIKEIYAKTRVLLMPSKYESWGMCATEAMCNGIPVIYNPTFGLSENVGMNGIPVETFNPTYVDPDAENNENQGLDPEGAERWVRAIKSLDHWRAYKKYSDLGRKRSRELDPQKELQEVENHLLKWIR